MYDALINRRLKLALLLGSAALLAACGTPMPLNSSTRTLDLSQQSIALLVLEQTREGDSKMPWPRSLSVRNLDSGKVQTVAVDSTFMDYGEDRRRYVTPLRLALTPGRYSLEQLDGSIQVFPMNGSFTVPLHMVFEVPPQAVFYMGRIHAHMRTRQEGELRAGPLIPLVSQTALGIATSTFDVRAKDMADVDIPNYREQLPVLANMDIQRRLIAPLGAASSDPAKPASASSQTPEPRRRD